MLGNQSKSARVAPQRALSWSRRIRQLLHEEIAKVVCQRGNVEVALLPCLVGGLEGGIVRFAVLSNSFGNDLISR